MRRNSSIVVVGFCLIMALAVPTSLATDYNVGDSAGWSIGTDYDTWAKDKTFKVGDNLGQYFRKLDSVLRYNILKNLLILYILIVKHIKITSIRIILFYIHV